MFSIGARRLIGQVALYARLLMSGVLVMACGGGDGDAPPPPPPSALATIALFAGEMRGPPSSQVGDLGGSGNADGVGAAARFRGPYGLAVDGFGNVYVADEWNHTIRKITPAGVVSTLAGSAGLSGNTDGSGADARFYHPSGVAADSAGNIYVADRYNGAIRKITQTGVVTTLARGADAGFGEPVGVATDIAGNIYVAAWSLTISKITPAGVISTLAGSAGHGGSADGSGADARFARPSGIATDDDGNVYVGDYFTIRKITPAGVVSTLAGTAGLSGSADGSGATARFDDPQAMATDGAGNVYVADSRNDTIRKITPAGVVSTLAGRAGLGGSADGGVADARFTYPSGIDIDIAGNIYVADHGNNTVRKITPAGIVSTLAGSAEVHGSADGRGADARFYRPTGLATDSAGNVYVADDHNHTIRKITPAALVSTLAGTAGLSGSSDGSGAVARFHYPSGVATDGAGNVYVVDTYNQKIRKVTPAGTVSTLAGSGAIGSTDGSGATASFRFCGPIVCIGPQADYCYPIYCDSNAPGIAADMHGNVYVAEFCSHTIRKITPAGVVSTLAGSAGLGGSADGSGADARFSAPSGVATDSAGNLYVADSNNHTIRKITPAGVVSTLAGGAGLSGSADGTGADARFNGPRGVATDSVGNLYVADFYNNTIRKVDINGVVTTVVGVPGVQGFSAGSLPGLLANPWGVAVSRNVLYVTLYNGVAVVTNLQ
jgi:sugar lactone lactonase YvrE